MNRDKISDSGRAGGADSDGVASDVARRLKPGPSYDPVNLMAQIFEDAPAFAGPAEDVLLSWLMRLSPDVEQSWAARQVLETIVGDLDSGASAECGKLCELLRQACVDNGSVNPGNRRRGGRSARVDR